MKIRLKQSPPITDELLKFEFPNYQEYTFSNGLTIILLRNTKLPKIYLRLGFDFGIKNDPSGFEGATELLVEVLKKGTLQHSYQEIVNRIDFIGGSLSISSTQDFFYIHGEFLSEFSDLGLELISEIAREPAFHSKEIDKELTNLLVDLENEKSSPAWLAQRRLNHVLFHPHPYSKTKNKESLKRIGRDTILKLHSEYFSPDNAILVIAGDIKEEDAILKIEEYFENWDTRQKKAVQFLPPQKKLQRKVYLVDRPSSEQSNILIGDLLFKRAKVEYETFQVMNKILGGGASSRLFMNLREKKGYTYGAYSTSSCLKDNGIWQAAAEVRTDVTHKSIEIFLEELERIGSEFVTVDELKNAKRYLIGTFPLKNETPISFASLIQMEKLLKLSSNYWETYLQSIDAVSKEDIRQIAEQYFKPGEMSIVVVGDSKVVKDSLKKFGEVEIYDLDDNRVI
jgi:predicted Zn-dependent peptidase